jgi:thermitase
MSAPANAAERDPLVPNDPLFKQQWALTRDAPLAWRITTGSPDTRIAIVDSGIDATHEDLAGSIVASYAIPGNADVHDDTGHGTAVAGIAAAAADNGIGIAGIAYRASLLVAKVTDAKGQGTCAHTADGIVWAAQSDANVIVVSSGGPAGCLFLEQAVEYAWERGALVVAAAGNEGTTTPNYPAAYPHVLSVGATDDHDGRATFSNHGADWVQIAAPGVHLDTTTIGPQPYGRVAGTSYAAPLVAGAAALIWPGVADSDGDGRRNDEVAERLLASADKVPGSAVDWQSGRLNVCKAAAAGADLCRPPSDPEPEPEPGQGPDAEPPTTEVPLPAVPPVTKAIARRQATRALRQRYGGSFRHRRHFRISCRVITRTSGRCSVSWWHARDRYRGTVTVRYALRGADGSWKSRLRVSRVSRP